MRFRFAGNRLKGWVASEGYKTRRAAVTAMEILVSELKHGVFAFADLTEPAKKKAKAKRR